MLFDAVRGTATKVIKIKYSAEQNLIMQTLFCFDTDGFTVGTIINGGCKCKSYNYGIMELESR